MPFTYFAHQLVVIPLKCARPRWFDGTALCVGSMAPDFAYALEHTPAAFASHNLPAQLFWSVPVALATTLLFRTRVADPLGAQLPGVTGTELRALAQSRRALWVTAVSGLIGGLSHLFLDGFTHKTGWGTNHIAALHHVVGSVAGQPIPVWALLQYLGHTLGTPLGLLLMAALIRKRAFSRWNAVPPQPEARLDGSAPLWRLVLLSLPLAVLATWSGHNLPVAIIRGTLTCLLGLALAAWWTSVAAPAARTNTGLS